jgi:putative chitinase
MSLKNAPAFFDNLRGGLLGPTLEPGEVSGLNAILDACKGLTVSQTAYCIATAYHETAHTMQPIREMGGPAYFFRMYDPKSPDPGRAKLAARMKALPGDGVIFYGRGYVQLTWRVNYVRADKELALGGALIAKPDKAMEPEIAAQIMRLGMTEGWFTGKSLNSYLFDGKAGTLDQFIACRKIINGTDKAALIAGYAMKFQTALQLGQWT